MRSALVRLLLLFCFLAGGAKPVDAEKREPFLERHQALFCLRVGDGLSIFAVGISAKTEGIVINKTGTTKRLGKKCFLFWRWVESFFTGAFCFHSYELSCSL